ncbi:hypothetical protein DUNSADRAFT_6173 [Dunaliella salina]|uniref:Secreted protein n=1 Tax=Dunaliella salina TaxID=3046 RepID=A0ABQ7GNW8_DUNSA|nr:hypothetical protein DUNSADRAFT_6173 [Dunaliella salina]|eukprot:KAF5836296.1 hypothetical protein DUNSADRAFT_6173 [Dunaliella salina]
MNSAILLAVALVFSLSTLAPFAFVCAGSHHTTSLSPSSLLLLLCSPYPHMRPLPLQPPHYVSFSFVPAPVGGTCGGFLCDEVSVCAGSHSITSLSLLCQPLWRARAVAFCVMR